MKFNQTIHEIATILYSHNLEWVALIVEECCYITKKEHRPMVAHLVAIATTKTSKDSEHQNQVEGHQLSLKTISPKFITGID